MNNVMIINGYRAVIQYDPEIEMFRGEFTGLNGGADFYADSVSALRQEGETSLRIFLETCREKGIEPTKTYSGKFQVRVPESVHKQAADAAKARGVSLNQLIATALEHELSA
ncbi:type II toxin-antitoxin system HicB family antitoxin [Chromohalobacter israelensis]|uniref:type II toxin-antitoxin system HicB family antitoxin n=1 Tax=Chromohalobacter israelensis TaxID=141390 RepID=UPI003D7AA2FB